MTWTSVLRRRRLHHPDVGFQLLVAAYAVALISALILRKREDISMLLTTLARYPSPSHIWASRLTWPALLCPDGAHIRPLYASAGYILGRPLALEYDHPDAASF